MMYCYMHLKQYVDDDVMFVGFVLLHLQEYDLSP